jgi:hypothetical protein
MGYPETAEGFLVKDTKNWSTFEKGEVRFFWAALKFQIHLTFLLQ